MVLSTILRVSSVVIAVLLIGGPALAFKVDKFSWDDTFAKTDVALMSKALSLINGAHESAAVWKCYNANRKSYQIKSEYKILADSAMKGGITETIMNMLLSYQSYYTSEIRTPSIHIHEFNEQSSTWGYALRDHHVTASWQSREPEEVTGDYEIWLNSWHMPEDWDADDAMQIAGVILHEMFHNLGHLHPSTGKYETDYDPSIQINTYQNCFVNKGRFTGRRVTDFVCGKPK